MLNVILIRPGSTDFDEQGRIQGALNIPLNHQGDVEVAQLVDELSERGSEKGSEKRIDAIYYSGCESAQQTAALLAKALETKSKKLENMQNLNHGLWEGMRIEELKRKHPKVYRQWQDRPESVCPPNGETLEMAGARVQTALKKIFRKHKQGTIALVVPEPLARLVRTQLNDSAVGNLWTAGEEHGRWEVIDVEPESLNKGT